ncbi:phage integrase SAM-like domain-containing protein [Chryseobacterium ginsenosidimutans]|uniref:tyrosine-type recombinase/integrase n=1 Tax=Chryseobacterium ginsenosidimutans TaxID=687846 RepID=UPI0031D6E58A
MTFFFFLTKNNTGKNINLKLIDENKKIDFIFRLPLYIDEKEWDKEKQRPKNIYLKNHKKINNKLDELKISLTEYLKSKATKTTITQRSLSKQVQKICSIKKNCYSENCLLNLIDYYITIKKGLICNSTYKRYKVFFNLIQRFEGHLTERLYTQETDMQIINQFLSFGKKEEYSENTIYRTIHFIKTILNFAERRGIPTHVRELEIRRERQQKEILTLSEQEILKIKHTKVPKDLQRAKDWLLISCYTGQRVSDFMRFSADKITKVDNCECLFFTQQKTKKEILLPLHPTVLNVIRGNNHSFPKPMSLTHYNEDIKKVAQMADLTQLVKVGKREGYRTKYKEIQKWTALTSHVGRRSFATNFYGRIPTALLMEATGHSTEQMFLQYINPINKERILSLSNYFDKMYKDRNSENHNEQFFITSNYKTNKYCNL